MAAAKPDPRAAKEAKQKKLVIVMSVVLLALLVWQLPKLLGGDDVAPAVVAAPAAGDPAAAPTAGAPTVSPADLAAAAAGAKPKPATSQLASFSLFEAKDPFIQKIVEKTETAKAASGDTAPEPGAGGGAIAAGGGEATPAVVYGFATIAVNAEPEAVQLKSEFPSSDPMFVVGAIGKSQIKIGIAGGKLTNGKLATIKLEKSLTLVDDATGARYVIKLLYTGAEPEATVDFSTTPAATTTSP